MANEGEFADFAVTYTAKQLEQEKRNNYLSWIPYPFKCPPEISFLLTTK